MTITTRLFFAFAFTFFTLIAAENTHTLKCPCFGSVSIPKTQVTHEAYDLIIRRLDHPAGPFIDNRLTRRNIIPTESKHARSDFAFHRLNTLSIPAAGKYSITMVPSIKSSTPAPDTMINIKSTVRQVSCPVLLSVQLPEVRRMAVQQPIEIHGVSKEAPARKIENGEFVWTDRQFDNNRVDADKRIVGGAFINGDLLPFMAAVVGPAGQRTICSGAILSERWVITAAHCGTTTAFTVFVSASQVLVDGTEIAVKNVFNNPRYGPNGRDTFWDIALIELEKSVTDEAQISSFMKVNFNSAFPADGAIVRVAGFGVISFGSEIPDPFPQRLRQVDLPIVTNRRCKLNYRRATSLIVNKRWQFCAGYAEGGCDSW